MNFYLLFKKHYFYIFLIPFFFIGATLSTKVGITHDELYDLNVWEANKNLFLNNFFNTDLDTSFLSGGSKFYGSGFHILSIPIESLTIFLFSDTHYLEKTKILLSKHITVFILFFISGLFFKRILKLIIENEFFSNLGTVFYFLNPYLLGHSFFNVKDIPFLTFWIICTYLIIKISKVFFKEREVKNKHVILISIFTAVLLSIRISGILIFIQYFLFFLLITNSMKINLIYFVKRFLFKILLSLISIYTLFIFLQPSYWKNPLLILEAIDFMSDHLQTVCTITLGECMKAQNLPSTYLPIWFFFKMPIVIIVGLILFPFVEKKITNQSLNSLVLISLICSIFAISLLLILLNVNLYDEIRQVMFLLPLIFIISLSMMFYFSKLLFNVLVLLSLSFFLLQNITLFPYNYIWINNFSHITKVKDMFELDYWGVSTKTISNFFNQSDLDNNICIISNRNSGLKAFDRKEYCYIDFKDLHKKNKRPFYVALIERGVNKGVPNNCNLVFKEEKNMNFSNEKLVLAKIFKCS